MLFGYYMVINKQQKNILILVDESYQKDYRVLLSIQNYKNPIVINCNEVKVNSRLNILKILINFFITLLMVIAYWKVLYSKYKLKPKGFFSGLRKSIYFDIKSRLIAKKFLTKYKTVYQIHAHDMFCGLVAKEIKKALNIPFIYDAHEVEFHRNRKNGFLRVVYDIILEKEIIKEAQKVIVVNQPIKKLYMDIYNIPESKISIVDNNHFTPHIGYALKNFSKQCKEIGITYVGGGVFGRKLEDLAIDSKKLDLNVYGFFLSKTPDVAYQNNWYLGSKEYLSELLALVQSKRLAMWSCTDDICLSYRLSLPNKFFQAMAIGIPVIAYKDTYLAEIVEKYNLGYIYDDNNFKIIIDAMKNDEAYNNLLSSIVLFQKKLFEEGLEL
jgi:glycosyltransferase involved in cell wall biosynthesis